MKSEEYLTGIRQNKYEILAKAITLIESSLEKDKEKAIQLIDKCIPFSGKSIRIGISGTPGVGKSTFIEKLGFYLKKKYKIAILAIDPSSNISKGSILGDKTRMNQLTNAKNIFIRPSPSRGQLGGVCNHTRDSIILCEAAGFNIILIETVGVGQSEVMVEQMTDYFIYMTLCQNGDELQFIKKGILELSDLILINKSDQNKQKAEEVKFLLNNTIQNFQNHKKQTVMTNSVFNHIDTKGVWNCINDFVQENTRNGHITLNRQKQNTFWIKENIQTEFNNLLFKNKYVQKQMLDIKNTNTKKVTKRIINKLIKEGF
ncbi:MAG: methylmalonyl Co-A mutase-associated GTPase MeaB [Flavobacteriales bacterium]|nr:methylmalonyl Co-A mutase-associated GTPase MeaB [Flavobacteriales bacterium]|tara:strand:+ start:11213 stop:12160 length:948 start_codon:yes stop_codon:yes gene_type:complete